MSKMRLLTRIPLIMMAGENITRSLQACGVYDFLSAQRPRCRSNGAEDL